MTALTVDKATFELLRQVNGPTELRGETGAVLGVFSPVARQVRRKVRTPEEEAALIADLERRAQDPGPDVTFKQAFERLLSLATDPVDQAVLRKQIERFAERE